MNSGVIRPAARSASVTPKRARSSRAGRRGRCASPAPCRARSCSAAWQPTGCRRGAAYPRPCGAADAHDVRHRAADREGAAFHVVQQVGEGREARDGQVFLHRAEVGRHHLRRDAALPARCSGRRASPGGRCAPVSNASPVRPLPILDGCQRGGKALVRHIHAIVADAHQGVQRLDVRQRCAAAGTGWQTSSSCSRRASPAGTRRNLRRSR